MRTHGPAGGGSTVAAVTVFYDAACPVCALEVDALAGGPRGCAIRAVDISAPGFDAASHGFAHRDLHAAMHLRRDDGTLLRGMDAVRALYAAAGREGAMAWTGQPGVARVADAAYATFARHRRAISGALRPVVAAIRRARGMGPARTGAGAAS